MREEPPQAGVLTGITPRVSRGDLVEIVNKDRGLWREVSLV